MTGEVEALLERIYMEMGKCDSWQKRAQDAAALIRSQVDAIARLQADYAAMMNKHAQPCCQQWDTCERQCVPLVKRLRVRLAIAKDEWNTLEAVYKIANEQIEALQSDIRILIEKLRFLSPKPENVGGVSVTHVFSKQVSPFTLKELTK
jgi:hypothetical protein